MRPGAGRAAGRGPGLRNEQGYRSGLAGGGPAIPPTRSAEGRAAQGAPGRGVGGGSGAN